MKVTTILGSPKIDGNTAKVLGLFEELIGQDHKVDRINIADSDIKGCVGCHSCQQVPDEPGCVQKDDVAGLFARMMKAFIDRHFCLATGYGTSDYESLVEGKRTALLVTCGGPIENNADLIQIVFDRLNDYGQCQVICRYVVPFCTTPDAIGPEAMETVKKMAADIIQLGGS
jgi:hypothetical protein